MLAETFTAFRQRTVVLKWILFAVLGALVVFDLFARPHHAAFWGDKIVGFWSMFGFVGCVVLCVVSKGLCHVWLEKETDYYDR